MGTFKLPQVLSVVSLCAQNVRVYHGLVLGARAEAGVEDHDQIVRIIFGRALGDLEEFYLFPVGVLYMTISTRANQHTSHKYTV